MVLPPLELGKLGCERNKLARPERFELPTYSSGGCRSIQLSYGRAAVMPVYIVGRPASMVADSGAFDARHSRGVRENWAVLVAVQFERQFPTGPFRMLPLWKFKLHHYRRPPGLESLLPLLGCYYLKEQPPVAREVPL